MAEKDKSEELELAPATAAPANIPPETTKKILKFIWDNKYEIITAVVWTVKQIKQLFTKKKKRKKDDTGN